jgi:predicted nucleotidyltransferase
MRKLKLLDALLPHTRQMLLALFLSQPGRWWYLSELAHRLRCRPSSLQRELASLLAAGILSRRRDGNRVYFRPDSQCPVLPELRGLIDKTIGLVAMLRNVLMPFAERIAFAFIYGSIARSEEKSGSDVDLLVVGQIGLGEIVPVLRKAERLLDRTINPVVYEPREFVRKLAAGHHFLKTVVGSEKIFIFGNAHDVATTLGE